VQNKLTSHAKWLLYLSVASADGTTTCAYHVQNYLLCVINSELLATRFHHC